MPVQMVDKKRPVGVELSQLKFSFGPFWTHKIKTKAKYISISNILHLLSTAVPVPDAEPIPASLVVDSYILASFPIDSNCKFDCCFELLCIQR